MPALDLYLFEVLNPATGRRWQSRKRVTEEAARKLYGDGSPKRGAKVSRNPEY